MNVKNTAACCWGALALWTSASWSEEKALSTSNLISIAHTPLSAETPVEPCSSSVAARARTYVSIDMVKYRVRKTAGWMKRLVNGDRRAFPAATFSATSGLGPLSISKLGASYVLKDKDSVIDLGSSWSILSDVPWTLHNANLQIRIGYHSDSSIREVVKSVAEITQAIPDYALSTSASVALAVAGKVDTLVFGDERVTDLLRHQSDLPLGLALCEGYYAVFAAENATDYDSYLASNLTWDVRSARLLSDNSEVDTVSFVIVHVGVKSWYYDTAQAALNDNQRAWAARYRAIESDLDNLFLVIDVDDLDRTVDALIEDIGQARTLLNADPGLLQQEKLRINRYVAEQLQSKLEAVRARLTDAGTVTNQSTINAISQFATLQAQGGPARPLVELEHVLTLLDGGALSLEAPQAFGSQLAVSLNRLSTQLMVATPEAPYQ